MAPWPLKKRCFFLGGENSFLVRVFRPIFKDFSCFISFRELWCHMFPDDSGPWFPSLRQRHLLGSIHLAYIGNCRRLMPNWEDNRDFYSGFKCMNLIFVKTWTIIKYQVESTWINQHISTIQKTYNTWTPRLRQPPASFNIFVTPFEPKNLRIFFVTPGFPLLPLRAMDAHTSSRYGRSALSNLWEKFIQICQSERIQLRWT